MTKITLVNGKYKVEVNIYSTVWRMNAASRSHNRAGKHVGTSHGCQGICHRVWYEPHRPGRVVASILVSWDTLTHAILAHELMHAAIHLFTYENQESGKIISTENDEELCYLQSDLLEAIYELFTEKQLNILSQNVVKLKSKS